VEVAVLALLDNLLIRHHQDIIDKATAVTGYNMISAELLLTTQAEAVVVDFKETAETGMADKEAVVQEATAVVAAEAAATTQVAVVVVALIVITILAAMAVVV
jgi:hypothetical protein